MEVFPWRIVTAGRRLWYNDPIGGTDGAPRFHRPHCRRFPSPVTPGAVLGVRSPMLWAACYAAAFGAYAFRRLRPGAI